MIKKSLTVFFLISFMIISIIGTASDKPTKSDAPAIPDNIKLIIDKSCFGCHNSDSKNEDAKKDLDFKTFDSLSKTEQVHALKEIGKVVNKGEMPPEKFLKRFPDKSLTDAEKKILLDWTKSEAKALMVK